MLRFGSVKCGKTAFSLLAVALTLQYLCIRKVETITGTAARYRRSLPPV